MSRLLAYTITMTRLAKIILASAAGAFFMIVIMYELRWKEPIYEGKPLHAWLQKIDHATPEEQLQVMAAVQVMGKRALPFLFDMLHATDSPVRDKFFDFITEYTVVRVPREIPADQLRTRAFPALAALRDQQPAKIIRHLTEALKQMDSAGYATKLLAIMGTNGLPVLVQALSNKEPYVRASAASALSSLHQFARVPETNKTVSGFLTACRITPQELCRNSKVF